LEGRSVPTDGSALNNNDREGVQCDFCHKLIIPSPLETNPFPNDPNYTADTYPQDQSYLSILTDIPPASANGMYVADASNAKRGPFFDAAARHKMYYSPFHSESDICGTCHDVSNPAFTKDESGEYMPNDWDTPAPDFRTETLFPVERTYSEWLMSEYNTSSNGVYAPQFGGNKEYVSSCQDCHMRDVTGVGCNKKGAPVRSDMPLHDLTGGNTFIPILIDAVFPGETNPAALNDGIQRATEMLQKAASLTLNVVPNNGGNIATVTVTNETGHKLPSGYPEGRRIWLNLRAVNNDQIVYESGFYDNASGVLYHGQTDPGVPIPDYVDPEVKIYEIKPGISAALAAELGLPAGPSFHFVLNNQIYKDNRIPPRGFTNGNFEAIQSPPVNYTYADGQYWDETVYTIPEGASRIEVTLYYQTTSREYVEFLRDENVTNDWGQTFYDLWDSNGKSAPVAMNSATFEILTTQPPVADFKGEPLSGAPPLEVNFTDLSTNTPTSWSWDFGDGGTSTIRHPEHTYSADGTYTVSLTATNSFGSDTETKTDYISVTTQAPTYVHAANISVTIIKAGGPNRIGQATITVQNQNDQPVSGAEVIGFFNAPNTSIKNGTTDASGIAIINSDKTKNPPADWCFEVTNISKSGVTYDPSHPNAVTNGCSSAGAARSLSYLSRSIMADEYTLEQNHPNPFNPSTEIRFTLPSAEHVTLTIYDLRGKEVAIIVNRHLDRGQYSYIWNAGNAASGIYMYRLVSRLGVLTGKMMLMK
jgi:PKD repeat protein